MMSCSCRTTSLRIFVQSLTELRLSNSAIPTTRRIQSRYPRTIGFQSQFSFSRPYSATTALSFPRQTSGNSISDSTTESGTSEATKPKTSDDGSVDEHYTTALNASTIDLDQAKRDGVILDFSPESIDALVANLDKSSNEDLTPRHEHVEPASPKLKPSSSRPANPSKLKRLKIVKEEPKKGKDKSEPSRKKEMWEIQKEALKKKFPEGWRPRKRLSPDALDGIRALHSQFPEDYTTEVLANKFEVSPDAIRRILRTKWTPSPEEEVNRQERWFNRGKNIWSQMAALGKKPPRRWRKEGIVRDPRWNIPKGPRTQPPRQRQPYGTSK
ncbi:hypothetical protein F5Y06DRAFT_271282 [Hypoxylon sp. FL0890]|nr:hypothetical protein F5Y06DRAFT_271282 [Hypoxylon sp. FL0890]